MDALNGSGICPEFKFVAISTRGDPSDASKEAVDIGLFPNDYVPVGEEVIHVVVPEGLAKVLPACSFLLNGVALRDRSIEVGAGDELDVLPPFAGG